MILKSLTVLAHGTAMGALALSSMAVAKERQPVSSTVDVPMPPAVSGSALPPVPGAPVVPAMALPQTVQPGMALAPGWWHGFGSPALDALVDRALAANTDIKAAQARLAQAQALVGAARGGLFPQVDAGLTSERQRLSARFPRRSAIPIRKYFRCTPRKSASAIRRTCSGALRRESVPRGRRRQSPPRKRTACATWWPPMSLWR